MDTLVVLLGPTGVGKTELALNIAEHLRTPIINADSRQIFKEIPIGTAAPTMQQQQRVKHYFVGTLACTIIIVQLSMRKMCSIFCQKYLVRSNMLLFLRAVV